MQPNNHSTSVGDEGSSEYDCYLGHDSYLDMHVVQAYNMQADGLQLIPASAKRAAGIQYEINLDRGGMTASELVDVDIKASPLQTPRLHSNPSQT